MPQPEIDWHALLDRQLPGPAMQRRWSPRLSYGRHFGTPRTHEAIDAAVAALCYPRDDAWHVALIRRPQQMLHHAGQIALPGGRVEAGETSERAMRRELQEELGVPLDFGQVVRKLTPVHVFASRFWMQPWLLTADESPEFVPQEAEVDEIIELPVAHLLDPGSVAVCQVERGRVRWRAPCVRWMDYEIWGATSLVLGELAALFGARLADPAD